MSGLQGFYKHRLAQGSVPIEQKETCLHLNTEVRITKQGKNEGKAYRFCPACKSFLGWAEENGLVQQGPPPKRQRIEHPNEEADVLKEIRDNLRTLVELFTQAKSASIGFQIDNQ